MANTLYYGDNLEILKQYIKDESIDLIYLDPPFNSNANYNVLFAEHSGSKSSAQIQVFEDTWEWGPDSDAAYREMVERGGQVSLALQAFRQLLGQSNMMAYLAMMAPRLVELHRVLKSTGSLYLHCDPTASHYLKILLDSIFGARSFENHITWKRSDTHNDAKKQFSAISDHILFYGKSPNIIFNVIKAPHNESHIRNWFINLELLDGSIRRMTKEELGSGNIPTGARRFSISDLSSPNPRPHLMYEYKGYPYPPKGWRVSLEKMEQLDNEGRLLFPSQKDGRIVKKKYLDEQDGIVIGDFWGDLPQLRAQDAERLGYPTQKPQSLLERIILASSNLGDVVLDPFCGCGTAVAAAQKLGRKWIGIDITHLAIALVKDRLGTSSPDAKFDVIGEPTTEEEARYLAEKDQYQFQWWALSLVGARPVDKKKGADQGIDGRLFFHFDNSDETHQVIFSVKAGNLNPGYVRDLHGVIDRENAEIGVLLTFNPPTRPMITEALNAGVYKSAWGDHPKIQIITVGELLAGKKIDMPPIHRQGNVTLKKAPRQKPNPGQQDLGL